MLRDRLTAELVNNKNDIEGKYKGKDKAGRIRGVQLWLHSFLTFTVDRDAPRRLIRS